MEDGTELTLHYSETPWQGMTRTYPGHPGEITIDAISIDGQELTNRMFNELMHRNEDAFMEKILDDVMGEWREGGYR